MLEQRTDGLGNKEPVEVIHLASRQKEQASLVLAKAFGNDPLYRLIFPDDIERTLLLRRLFGAVIGYSLKYGRVHSTSSVAGVACWLPPGNTDVTFWRMMRTGLAFQRTTLRIPSEDRRELVQALAYIHDIHQRQIGESHWYLWALGVEPGRQRQGVGGALIKPILAEADRDGRPCYLETKSVESVAFYQKWGFEQKSLKEIPGLNISVWSMIRESRRQ